MHTSLVAHQAGAYPGFSSMKRLGVFLLVHRRVTPSIKFAGTHLYTWVERGTMRVKCLAQEHNTMSPARARTRSARSGVERSNHEATAPPLKIHVDSVKFILKGNNSYFLLLFVLHYFYL